jgi:hypothetical protein
MAPVEFELKISADESTQTNVLVRAATGPASTGLKCLQYL